MPLKCRGGTGGIVPLLPNIGTKGKRSASSSGYFNAEQKALPTLGGLQSQS